ncbi:MAG: hypothetical protein ABFQ89_04245 [Chloroflexota bacterium]
MELRKLLGVLWRRWPLVVIPFAIVLALGLVTYQRPSPAYNVGIRYTAGQVPDTGSVKEYEDDRYYPWLTSEYVVSGLKDWVKSGSFAQAVSDELNEQGIDVSAGAVQGSISSDSVRSVMLLSMTFGDRDTLAAMINAATKVLKEKNQEAFPFQGEAAVVVPIDQPVINQIPVGLRATLDLPIRLILALVAGLALAFFVEYLDPSVRTRHDLERVDILVIVEIPKHK